MEAGLPNRTYTVLSLLWWLIVVCLIVLYYLLQFESGFVLLSMLRAIPVTSGLLLYYYGHQYLINRYLLNNDVKRYIIFLLLLLVIQSVGSYNINHLLFVSNMAEAALPHNSFRFFFTVNLLFDLCTFLGILATIKALSIRKELESVQTEHGRIRDVFLRSQINHHSLLNTMNSIYYLSITSPDATSDAILKASDLLKYILVQTEKQTVPVADELKFIFSFVELQKLRLGNTRQISYSSPTTALHYTIPPLLLIALIENAFKYSSSTVKITINIQHDVLELHCINDVLKRTADSNGVGLRNLKERLQLIYADNYLFRHTEDHGFYEAILKIKLFHD